MCPNEIGALTSYFSVHVTDIHYSVDRVEQLKSWLTATKLKVDIILISGDIANGPMDWSLSDEQVKKYHHDLETVLESFTQVKNNVYFVPGNVSTFCNPVNQTSSHMLWYT